MIQVYATCSGWFKHLDNLSSFTVFTEDVILAQAAVFVAAGFETSSSTIAFALYEIAKNVSNIMLTQTLF